MPGQIFAIARNAFVESLRQPIFLILILVAAALQFFSTWSTGFAMGYTDSGEVSSDNKLLLDIGLASVFILSTLLSAFVATAVLAREIDNKTVLTVVSKPVGRPSVVIGKYLGVAAAIALAAFIMLVFLLLGLRHGVMTTAADKPDMPVILFGFGLGILALAVAAWCNFYYGWSFPQTSVVLLAPAMALAYFLVLLISKEWKLQPLTKDMLPQIYVGCGALLLATLVLTAVAIAASTRLGQVMTIVVCVGVFVASMLSNHFIGRHAFSNTAIARVADAQTTDPAKTTFRTSDETWTLRLLLPAERPIEVGALLYYGSNPNGFDLATPTGAADPDGEPAGVVVTEVVSNVEFRIRNRTLPPTAVARPPRADDWIFLTPTRTNPAALAAWSALPNLQYFWLLDAITQNQRVPFTHVLLLVGYGGAQIAAILSLAVVLFQRRDVG